MAQHRASLQQVLRRSLASIVYKGFCDDLWLKKHDDLVCQEGTL
jgi:hypothetical protein